MDKSLYSALEATNANTRHSRHVQTHVSSTKWPLPAQYKAYLELRLPFPQHHIASLLSMFSTAKLNLLRQAAQFMGDIPYDSQQGTPLTQLGEVCEVQRIFSRAIHATSYSSHTPAMQEEELVPQAGPSRPRSSARVQALDAEGPTRKRKKTPTNKSSSSSGKRSLEVGVVEDVHEDEEEEDRPAKKRTRVAASGGSSSRSKTSRPCAGRVDASAKENVDPVKKVSTLCYLS